jgi:hypothetical protein
MEHNEKIAFYLPYKIEGIYRLGDVVDNAPNPDEMRKKVLTPESADFFLKYCKPILKPIENAMTLKIDFNGEEDYFHNNFFGFTNFKAYWKEYEDYGFAYWNNRAPFVVTLRLIQHKLDAFNMIGDGLAISEHDASLNGA